MRLRAADHTLPPPVLDGRLGWLARLIVVVGGAGSERFAARATWKSSNTFFGNPFGFAGVCTIKGGTALMMAAFETRLSPCRAM